MSKNHKQKTKVDPFMVGYQFTMTDGNKTPADFTADPDTGLRPGSVSKPSGIAWLSLREGLSGRNIPSLGIWKDGFWFDEWDKVLPKTTPPKASSSYKVRNLWVCSGEGTPSNYEWRVYEVPDEIALQQAARHPGIWSKRLKEDGDKTPWGASTYSTPSTPEAAKIPLNVRFRCESCGHYFKESDLTTHMQYTCPVLNSDQGWGMMCDTLCGCENLHQASTPKPGFPRQKAPTTSEPEVALEQDGVATP